MNKAMILDQSNLLKENQKEASRAGKVKDQQGDQNLEKWFSLWLFISLFLMSS